ncbi:hypothetical protein KMW28_19245 [Flammeovirga yaeyamensis]|uniref:Agarase n=1 Tax=Flammeovirga yaeyamensis TaxID=367791 RepID=A0AAX1N2E3_9BACT|nr:agarase [Flammeovirga yaeyamensis]MBB3700758.1 hypothetical protein [Flammeovirga yaeyamensis]NMF37886.1 agarase [Flammeovirga yaeyamensis]QWG01753.1 hypothetical protein KMW28_19245 [Flammeovirga yaeyamensis]
MNQLLKVGIGLLIINVLFSCEKKVHDEPFKVEVRKKIYPGNGQPSYLGDWELMDTQTLDHLDLNKLKTTKLDKYGGEIEQKFESTGYFRTQKIDGRWWIIDPLGHKYIHKAVNSINKGKSDRNKEAFRTLYATTSNWMEATADLLWQNGFNGMGSWSNYKAIQTNNSEKGTHISYTVNLSLMGKYGKKRGGTYAVPGHLGYPNNAPFIFDKGFEEFCFEFVKNELPKYKNDDNLLGYFTDNEMPFKRNILDGYLKNDPSDEGYIAAKNWLEENSISKGEIDDAIRDQFLAYTISTYMEVVTNAIKAVDPNHLILGIRLYTSEKNNESFMTAYGKYVDVVSVNYYHRWTPKQEEMNDWEKWTQKPFMITEWYTKSDDTGLPNNAGAGWVVKTQNDRGLFYQNYTLGLMKNKNCVGWHWFKYIDNDPTMKNAELSNTDSNKGIIDYKYEPYQDLMIKMKDLNERVYALIQSFDQESNI